MFAQGCVGSSLCPAAAAMPKRKATASLATFQRIVAQAPAAQQIFVKFANGYVLTLDVEPSDTINIVKANITAHIWGQLRPDQQRLIFAEHHNLLNGRTLSDYNIRHGDTLHCCRRAIGIPVAQRRNKTNTSTKQKQHNSTTEYTHRRKGIGAAGAIGWSA